MPLEMRECDQGVGIDNIPGYEDRLEMIFLDSDATPVIPTQPIGDGKGGLDNCIGEPVLDSSDQVVDSIGPAAPVQRI